MMNQSAEIDVKIRIMLAAKKLFARQGYDGTSVRQICEEAGANIALVSYHFGGKEKVFEALFKTFFPLDKMPDLQTLMHEPVIGLVKIITEVTRLRQSDPELISVLQNEIAMHSPRLPLIQQYALPLWRALRSILQLGREQGIYHFRSLDQTMLLVMGTMFIQKQSHYFEPLLDEGEPSVEELVSETSNFVFNALKYDGERPL